MIGLQSIMPVAAKPRRSAKQRFLERDERRRQKEAGLFESRREIAEAHKLEAHVSARTAAAFHERDAVVPVKGLADLLLSEL